MNYINGKLSYLLLTKIVYVYKTSEDQEDDMDVSTGS